MKQNQPTTLRLKELAGIAPSIEDKINDWIDTKGEIYGPDANEEGYLIWQQYMDELQDSDKSDPNKFIEEAIKVILKYTSGYYGDSTTFDNEEVKNDFFDYIKR